MPRPACFLDRHDLERILADAKESRERRGSRENLAFELLRLRDAGFVVIAASNEPTVASGARTERDVQDADRLLAATLADEAAGSPIERFYWCPFSPDAEVDRYRFDHPWRKPRPGMLLQAAEDLDLDLASSWMLAGREEDLAAARVAGMRVAALRTIGDEQTSLDLAGAVDAVLRASLSASESPSSAETRETGGDGRTLEAPEAPAPTITDAKGAQQEDQQDAPEVEVVKAERGESQRAGPAGVAAAARTASAASATPSADVSSKSSSPPLATSPATSVTAAQSPSSTLPPTFPRAFPSGRATDPGQAEQEGLEQAGPVAPAEPRVPAGRDVRTAPAPGPGHASDSTSGSPSLERPGSRLSDARSTGDGGGEEALLAAIRELTEELRQGRAGARELSGGRVVALLLELGVLLAAAMGLVQLAEPMLFAKWFLGAVLLQLAAIALLLFDRR